MHLLGMASYKSEDDGSYNGKEEKLSELTADLAIYPQVLENVRP